MQTEVKNYLDLICTILQSIAGSMYMVGGCIRDMLQGIEPSDYDIITDVTYTEVYRVFADYVFAEGNSDGYSISIITKESSRQFNMNLLRISINGCIFDIKALGSKDIKVLYADLSERDFTINSIALNYVTNTYVDIVNGRRDIAVKRLRCFGSIDDKFISDPLRILRAYRFKYGYHMEMDVEIEKAIQRHCTQLYNVSAERKRDELFKLIALPEAGTIIRQLQQDGVLSVILPEMFSCVNVKQVNKHHCYDVFEHSVRVMEYIRGKTDNVFLCFAGLLHDIGKPVTKKKDIEGIDHFYKHPIVGAQMVEKICKRYRVSKVITAYVVNLVLYHDTVITSEKQARSLIEHCGEEVARDILLLREADIFAQSVFEREKKVALLEKSSVYVEQAIKTMHEVQLKDLKINGYDLIQLGYSGAKIGVCLKLLLNKVREDRTLNNRVFLLDFAKQYLEEIENGKEA